MTFRAPAAFAALIFSAVAALAAPAEGAADAARVAAQTVIERVAALPATSPAAVPEWNAARAGAPLLVHAPDAAPAYFIVPVADAAGRVVGVVTVGAADGAWRSYARRAPGAPPGVSRYRHNDIMSPTTKKATGEVTNPLSGG